MIGDIIAVNFACLIATNNGLADLSIRFLRLNILLRHLQIGCTYWHDTHVLFMHTKSHFITSFLF